MKSSNAACVPRAARKRSSRAALAVERVRPQRRRSSSCGDNEANPLRRKANAASSSPNGGRSGACSLPALSSSFDSGSAPGGEVEGLDAVVAVNQLQGRVETRHRWHHFEVEVPRERLRLIWIEAVA